MQIAVNFENNLIAEKVLWILEHFKNDGVEVIKLDNTDTEILDNFREGLVELKNIQNGKDSSRAVEDFLDEKEKNE